MGSRTVIELRHEDLRLEKLVSPGDTVIWSQGTSEPVSLIEALVGQRHRLGRVRVVLGSSYSDAIRPEHADAIDFIGIGAVGRTRAFLEAGVLGVIPCHLTDVHRLILDGRLRIDVVFLQVSENARGELSYGAVSSYLPAAVERARVVIAEINDRAPWTHSNVPLDRSRVAYAVRASRPLENLPMRAPTPNDARIAKHVAALVEDGSVLQIGIGTLPDAVLATLTDRRELGIHSGIISDGVVELVERGVVTNSTKPVDRGITVTGGLFGSKRLYDFAHLNPKLRVDSLAYTHSLEVMGRFDAFVAINAAIEVDLTGQINSEVANGRYIGSVGGQTDFARAAAQSPRGRSIVVVPSRTGREAIKRIVARFADGVVSTARADADVVVTEYGTADLRGQTIPERVRRMVAIAHPEDREGLDREAASIPGMLPRKLHAVADRSTG